VSTPAAYEPKPGSVAFRALAHLQGQPPGTELSTAALAESVSVVPTNLANFLAPLVKHGHVACRQKGGFVRSPLFWSLPKLPRNDLTAKAAADLLTSAINRATRPLTTLHGLLPAQKPDRVPAAATRIALWSTGELEIHRAGEALVLLTADETRALVAYLERMAEASDA
jgi:hypothetical protein